MKRLALFALGLTLLAGAFAVGTRFASREAVFAASPDGRRVAYATDRQCASGPCQTLWIGADRQGASKVATLGAADGRCDEIVWTRDGSRVAFLVDGRDLLFYDAGSLAPAGRLDLLPTDAASRDRLVRGVTFSENGRAVTYDECPRGRSGCRAGLAAVPYQ